MSTKHNFARSSLLVLSVLSILQTAHADEQTKIVLASGNWAEIEHSVSDLAPPDTCIATSASGQAVIRADADDIEFRTANNSWSLPDNVSGLIKIRVGSQNQDININFNSAHMVAGKISKETTTNLLDAMAKSNTMTVQAGKDPAVTVSLSGSNKVLSAFRTCSHIGGSSGGGSNPFQ